MSKQRFIIKYDGDALKSAFSNLITVLTAIGFIGGGGIIGFILKVKKDKKIEKIEFKNNESHIKIVGDHNIYIENLHIGKLLLNNNCTYHINKIVKPLEQDGIDSFECGINNETISILKNDLIYFNDSQPEEALNKNTTKQWVTIESINFKEKKKWKVNYGGLSIFANIEDIDFINKINTNEVLFCKNDMLRVDLMIEQFLFQNTLKNRYTILKVLEHKHVNQLKIHI
jgi:hypothetical protein